MQQTCGLKASIFLPNVNPSGCRTNCNIRHYFFHIYRFYLFQSAIVSLQSCHKQQPWKLLFWDSCHDGFCAYIWSFSFVWLTSILSKFCPSWWASTYDHCLLMQRFVMTGDCSHSGIHASTVVSSERRSHILLWKSMKVLTVKPYLKHTNAHIPLCVTHPFGCLCVCDLPTLKFKLF